MSRRRPRSCQPNTAIACVVDFRGCRLNYLTKRRSRMGRLPKQSTPVTAAGSIYFSSAANSGNKTLGTPATWERDFLNGGAVSGVVGTSEGGVGSYHNFNSPGDGGTPEVI